MIPGMNIADRMDMSLEMLIGDPEHSVVVTGYFPRTRLEELAENSPRLYLKMTHDLACKINTLVHSGYDTFFFLSDGALEEWVAKILLILENEKYTIRTVLLTSFNQFTDDAFAARIFGKILYTDELELDRRNLFDYLIDSCGILAYYLDEEVSMISDFVRIAKDKEKQIIDLGDNITP